MILHGLIVAIHNLVGQNLDLYRLKFDYILIIQVEASANWQCATCRDGWCSFSREIWVTTWSSWGRWAKRCNSVSCIQLFTVFTLRHIQYNNHWIKHGKEYDPVFLNTWMNVVFWTVCIALPNSFYIFPWHKHAYMKIMNRL